ncbi:Stf0 family sulfotransferase [Ruegeria arenilitoris]|uniref:Stf0 family sulfotransferase n=1 Tax=Ruegeria arenilitoris TaxID=1173585 RepID=UPI003C7D5378
MNDFDSYLICRTPRSGSTLLCQLLAATGCAGKPVQTSSDCACKAKVGPSFFSNCALFTRSPGMT